ncbi:MAG: ThiF family adenylyltransferase [Paludibacteraceae bacterium]|nr:ThiF family adenylyltransferase [Paludibacteraceae bacterium]
MKRPQIPSREDLYSRSKGILEVDILKDKSVAVVGLGSFGSTISVELAKAGVGVFHLYDFDTVELHNIARHTATVHDLGRLKTDVMEEAILGKNPYAEVHKYEVNISTHPEALTDIIQAIDLIICATDNNRSRFVLSELACQYGKTCIYGRAFTRAEGGDVFIQRPAQACYCCLVGNQWFDPADEEITDEASARRDGTIPAYTSPEDADAMVQVGLSSDILPVCNMMVKLALLSLSRGRESGIAALDEELVYNYYMWANRRERRFSNWRPFNNAGHLPTILRWYGAHIPAAPDCAVCSETSQLITD